MITKRTTGEALVVEVNLDEITADNARKLTTQALESVGVHPAVALSLREVDHLDSSGLSFLITLLKRISEHDGRLILCHVGPRVMSLLKLVRMTQVFTIMETEDDAVAALGASLR